MKLEHGSLEYSRPRYEKFFLGTAGAMVFGFFQRPGELGWRMR